MTYRIFTLQKIAPFKDGARVTEFPIPGVGITIPAIFVGERGQGCELGVLPVQLTPEQRQEWEKKGGRINIATASIGQTRAGKPKLNASPGGNLSTEHVICVLRTEVGFWDENNYTGDLQDEWWFIGKTFVPTAEKARIPLKERYTADEVRNYSPPLMDIHYEEGEGHWCWHAGFARHSQYAPFPGKILTRGIIAEGGEQLVALIPKGAIWRTAYSDGAPDHHYHVWTGEKILSATKEERELADLF